MIRGVVGALFPAGVAARLVGGVAKIKHDLKINLEGAARQEKTYKKRNQSVSMVKDALQDMEKLLPEEDTHEFKKQFADILQIVQAAGCGGYCLIADDADFKEKANNSPRIHYNNSTTAKGVLLTHYTYTPSGHPEVNVVFISEIAEVSLLMIMKVAVVIVIVASYS